VCANGVNVSSYYKWQRKVYAAAQAQQERSFVEVTPVQSADVGGVAVSHLQTVPSAGL